MPQQDRHLLAPSKSSNDRNGLHLAELLVKRAPENPLEPQAIVKAFVASLLTGSKALLLKTTPVSITEHGEG